MKLFSEDTLVHYGISGMKHGVRRWQYEDGRFTPEGKERYFGYKGDFKNTRKDVNDIISTLSLKDKQLLNLDKNKYYLTMNQNNAIVYRSLIKDKKGTPVSFFDLLNGGKVINVAFATRNGKKYRNKGYAKRAIEQGMNFIKNNPKIIDKRPILWNPDKNNIASIKLAEQNGFIRTHDKKYLKYNIDDDHIMFIKDYSKNDNKTEKYYTNIGYKYINNYLMEKEIN